MRLASRATANRRHAASEAYRHRHHDEIVILLPDPIVLRVIARSVLLAAALLSFPWLRTMLVLSAATEPAPANYAEPKWVDSPFFLRMLVADLKRQGLFRSELRNLFLGDPGSRILFLMKNHMDLISVVPPEYCWKLLMVEDNSVDFVLAADGFRDSSVFEFVDRVLKVGGIVTVRLGSDTPCRLPANYRVAYIRRFGSTVVALKKISHGDVDVIKGRRLLSIAKMKGKQQKKTACLRNALIGSDSFVGSLVETAVKKISSGIADECIGILNKKKKKKDWKMTMGVKEEPIGDKSLNEQEEMERNGNAE